VRFVVTNRIRPSKKTSSLIETLSFFLIGFQTDDVVNNNCERQHFQKIRVVCFVVTAAIIIKAFKNLKKLTLNLKYKVHKVTVFLRVYGHVFVIKVWGTRSVCSHNEPVYEIKTL